MTGWGLIIKSNDIRKIMPAIATELYFRIQEPKIKYEIDKDDYFSMIARANDILVSAGRESYYDYDHDQSEYRSTLSKDYNYILSKLTNLCPDNLFFGIDNDEDINKYGYWRYQEKSKESNGHYGGLLWLGTMTGKDP